MENICALCKIIGVNSYLHGGSGLALDPLLIELGERQKVMFLRPFKGQIALSQSCLRSFSGSPNSDSPMHNVSHLLVPLHPLRRIKIRFIFIRIFMPMSSSKKYLKIL